MHIERLVVTGLIVSTDYLQQIRTNWNIQFLEDATAKRIAGWCWEYFEKYNKAPGKEIKSIFYQKVKEGLPKDTAEEIEQDILPDLSEEYEQTEFNLKYYIDETQRYFKERSLIIHNDQVQALITEGKLEEAEAVIYNYTTLTIETDTDSDFNNANILTEIEQAFDTTQQTVIRYPRQLGKFWDEHLVKGGLVMLMASDKRGKTFMLLDMAMKACNQKKKVAFFEAGDMTKKQLQRRICIYLTQKSDLKKYCEQHWEPTRDCVYNQINDCNKKERECTFGIFDRVTFNEVRNEITAEKLIEAYKEEPEYKPCCNCPEYEMMPWGTVWLRPIKEVTPLTVEEAKKAVLEFFIQEHHYFKLSVYPNDTLSIGQINTTLTKWEKENNFIPDVIIIDYADLLVTEKEMDERPKQNKIWKGLRRLSQEKGQPLVVTATQADAKSYDQNLLKLSNFSEDKRKYSHITAGFGLNQDPKGREKKLGITRINTLVAREGDFDVMKTVTILQNLRRGRPFIGSMW